MASKPHVVVLGAGVTGLTSALFLAEAGYEVTVVAAHVPGDSSIEYTSPWAGADWRAQGTPDQPMVCSWEVQTFDHWVEVMDRERLEPELPKSGVKMFDSYGYFDGPVTEVMWWAPFVPEYRVLSPHEEPLSSLNASLPVNAPTVQNAIAYRTMSLNVPQYLLYLQEKARLLGVEVIKARLPVDSGLETAIAAAEKHAVSNGRKRPHCIVNATGLGAGKLCGDDAMYPIRGQTVLVKGEGAAIRTRSSDGYGAYCIPRPGSGQTILGGVKEIGSWSEAVDEETTRLILERCACIAPELLTGDGRQFEVISAQCGLRPARKGGPRLEKEVVDGRQIVHAYGHGGFGYQTSVGSARRVVELVGESTRTSAESAKL